MTTRYTNEAQLLQADFRRDVIKEIVHSTENLARKAAELRKEEIYNDQSKKWVMLEVQAEGYKDETVAQMRNRATNISFAKKIVNKLARTYTGGVERKLKDDKAAPKKPAKPVEPPKPAPDPEDPNTPPPAPELPPPPVVDPEQVKLDAMADELNFNTQMKAWDRKRQLHRNSLLKIVPYKDTRRTREAQRDQLRVELRPLAPWQYDVLEDPNNKEIPGVVILSEFFDRGYLERADKDGQYGKRDGNTTSQGGPDGRDQTIADSPEDNQAELKDQRFIWWSDTFHFTTDGTGAIVAPSPADLKNPIQRLPFVNQCGEQDGAYWAKGGEDVTDGSVLLNKQLTDVNFISYVQGWGQMYIAARNVPKKIVGGPDNCIIFEKQDPTETVQLEYASSDPHLEAQLETIRMSLALLLSTSGLSTRHIAAKLNDVSQAPSALAMMVEDAEVIGDTKDVQTSFQDVEPEVWEIVNDWWALLQPNNFLVPDQQEIEPLKSTNVQVKFFELKPPTTDKEKYETMKVRKEVGVCTTLDLIKQDNPDLTDQEAKAKLEEVKSEKVANAAAFGVPPSPGAPGKPGDKGSEGGLNPADKKPGSPPPFGKPDEGK